MQWREEGDRLSPTTSPKTAFWRITHYGFICDNSHFYFETVATEFIVGFWVLSLPLTRIALRLPTVKNKRNVGVLLRSVESRH